MGVLERGVTAVISVTFLSILRKNHVIILYSCLIYLRTSKVFCFILGIFKASWIKENDNSILESTRERFYWSQDRWRQKTSW